MGVLADKSYAYSLEVVKVCRGLNVKKEFILSSQLLRSGTSVGANIAEGKYAQSKSDFVSKLSISLKEANESQYWIRLLFDSGYIDEKSFNFLTTICDEVIRLLISSIKTLKNKSQDFIPSS